MQCYELSKWPSYITRRGIFLGYLLTIQDGCPTVKAFHRMTLNQNKCLNSNTSKSGKTNKNGRKKDRLRIIEFLFFWNANKNFRVAGKN